MIQFFQQRFRLLQVFCVKAFGEPAVDLHQQLSGFFPLALLAEAYGKVGEAEQGLAALVEALAQVEKTGERFYEAELYQLKGTLIPQKFQFTVRSNWERLLRITKPRHFKNLAGMGLQVPQTSSYKFGTQVAIDIAHLAIF